MELSIAMVFMFVSYIPIMTYLTFGKEQDRTMLFPDYFFFAERRLINHKLETKYVKDLDHCELFCYMNDDCVSANFKKDPETGGMAHECELSNASHLHYDTDLILDATFHYRGSENACGENSLCQNNATCQSGFTIKGYRCLCPPGFEGAHCEKEIDECQANTHDCHQNATCENTNGSFVCTCLFGFNGNGHNCTADSCYNYKNLSDDNRNTIYDTPLYPVLCDKDLSEGWYRFVKAAGTRIPTTCVDDNKCGTANPGWLTGNNPAMEDGEVNRKVCFRKKNDCCHRSVQIKAKNCGSYHIYKLFPPPTCNLRYCGTD